MKKLTSLVLGVLLSPVVLNAGNMFGPAPFRNGSPLVTGIDGTYQATARAENVTGIFRFAYSGGSQTTAASQNSWIFFVNGVVQRGTVVSNIIGSSVNGIFDNSSSVTSSTNNVITLPYIVLNENNSSSGTFSGNIQLNSPSGSFRGSGELQGLPQSVSQVVAIFEGSTTTGNTTTTFVDAVTLDVNNAAGTLPVSSFKFRGVRTSTSSGTTPQIAPN